VLVSYAPMGRRVFTLAAAVSALLWASVAALWGWSYLPGEVRLGVADGRLVVVGVDSSRHFADDLWDAEGSRRDVVSLLLRHATTTRHAVPGVVYAEGRVQGSSTAGRAWGGPYGAPYSVVSVHCAYLTIPLAVLPALWLWARRRLRRRIRHGHCTSCGYDLRASPRRCPECGTIPAADGEPAGALGG
jgi:hypothetical protein